MLNRRHFIGAAAAASALPLAMAAPTHAQSGRPPAPAKGDALRIEEVNFFNAGRVIVQVKTDDRDISGYGEINTMPGGMAVGIGKQFAPLLKGVDPFAIEHIWQMLFRAHRNVRGGMLHASVIGGIDIALWDLKAKALNVPLHSLLGGPTRQKLRYYPSKSAFKQTTHSLHEMVETPAMLDRAEDDVRKLRDKLGKGGYVMFDGHGKFTPQVALQLCKRLEKYDVLYMEEVVPPEQLEDLAKVAAETTVPLCAGERLATVWPFRRLFETGAAGVLNPDIVRVGGVSQMMKLAHLAEVYDVPLAPHGTHCAIGAAATLHTMAAINNFLIAEVYGHIVDKTPYAKGLPAPDGTFYPLPQGPGLGVAVDEDAVEEAAAKHEEKGEEAINKAYFTDDGAVADR